MASQPPREGPSEEELAAYLSQLRDAPLTDLIAQAVAMLVNAAQVKLGLADGRALIDATAAVVEAAGERIDEGFRREVDGILDQLRMAQVEAEQQLAPGPGGGAMGTGGEEAGDDGRSGDAASSPGPSQQEPGSAPSRLWVPPGAS
jgi:hypothetical protein